MQTLIRRHFMKTLVAGGLTAGAISRSWARAAGPKRKMTIDLACGRIGVRVNLRETVELAARHGFESLDPSAAELARLAAEELAAIRVRMQEANLTFGAAAVGVDFRRDEAAFASGMQKLPRQAQAMAAAGVQRAGTYLRPRHDELTYLQNFRLHTRRLRAIAEVLGEQGVRFGLEYVGPKTSWTAGRHAFVHTMREAQELIHAIGTENVGLVLDSWHWYCAHETADDIAALSNDEVVVVDLNDAPAGIPVDEQIDNIRELPCATGVIDAGAFLGALNKIGYDGPVRAEPFNAALTKLPAEKAVALTAKAMQKAFAKLQ